MQDRVEINVLDDKIFKDLALLCDRTDFTKDLNELRKLIKKESENNLGESLFTYLSNLTCFEKVKQILKKYRYPLGFSSAIFVAATKGSIKDEDVTKCYSTILMHPFSHLDQYRPLLTRDEFVFSVPLYSAQGNVDKIACEFKNTLKSLKHTHKPLPKMHPLRIRKTSDIRDHREWYWRKKLNGRGESDKIASEYNVELTTVDQATSRYAKRLKADI